MIRNIEQFLKIDEENQTAWLELGNGGYWWYWYGSEFEAHAWYLKLLAAAKPRSPQASGLVKYLVNNRKHATYWKSTRDTASHFYLDYLPKGVYVFEYSVRVQHRGQYQTGMTNVQCMYAPEFNSHSQSIGLVVE